MLFVKLVGNEYASRLSRLETSFELYKPEDIKRGINS